MHSIVVLCSSDCVVVTWAATRALPARASMLSTLALILACFMQLEDILCHCKLFAPVSLLFVWPVLLVELNGIIINVILILCGRVTVVVVIVAVVVVG